jgi:hypothetical protein
MSLLSVALAALIEKAVSIYIHDRPDAITLT